MSTPSTRITVQGGVTTSKEHNFLLKYYPVDQVGWGTPFLLCPEATNVDRETFEKLCQATEKDLFTSDVSPVGVPFNNLRSSASEIQKHQRIKDGYPGSPCYKGHLAFSSEFTLEPLCVASRRYQTLKIKRLDNQRLTRTEYNRAYQNLLEKSCICHELGGSFLIKNNLLKSGQSIAPAICPGPTMAYFSREYSLKELADHIYGRADLLSGVEKPHVFIKEIKVNIDYLEKEISKFLPWPPPKEIIYFLQFWRNLTEGMKYYRNLAGKLEDEPKECRKRIRANLRMLRTRLDKIIYQTNLNAKLHIMQRLQKIRENIKHQVDKKRASMK